MNEVRISLWDILFLPVALPLKSVGWALTYLAEEVEKETGEEAYWQRLLEMEVLKELGELPDVAHDPAPMHQLDHGNGAGLSNREGDDGRGE